LTYFSCCILFFTCFSTSGLAWSWTPDEPLNLERGFSWLEDDDDDLLVQLRSNPLFSFSCCGVQSAWLSWKALVEKSMLGSRTENMSPLRSWSTLRGRCNRFSIDFWIRKLFAFWFENIWSANLLFSRFENLEILSIDEGVMS